MYIYTTNNNNLTNDTAPSINGVITDASRDTER